MPCEVSIPLPPETRERLEREWKGEGESWPVALERLADEADRAFARRVLGGAQLSA